MLTVAIPKRNKLQNIIVLTPKDGNLLIADAVTILIKSLIKISSQKLQLKS